MLSLQRIIERLLEFEVLHVAGQRRVVQGVDQFWILQEFEITLLVDQVDDFRVVAQGEDSRVPGQPLGPGLGEKTFSPDRTRDDRAGIPKSLIGRTGDDFGPVTPFPQRP